MSNEKDGDSTASSVADIDSIAESQLASIFSEELAEELSQSIKDNETQDADPEGEEELQDAESGDSEDSIESDDTETNDGENDPDLDDGLEEDEDSEEEDSNVLSNKESKALENMRKRIDKLTARAKAAEEKLEQAEKADSNKSDSEEKKSGAKTFSEHASNLTDNKDLDDLEERANDAIDWADDALDELRDTGEEFIELNGHEYTKEMIRELKSDARKALKTSIPKRKEVLQARNDYDNAAVKYFPFLADEESEDYKYAQSVLHNPALKPALDNLPEQALLVGMIAEGYKVLQSRIKGESQEKKVVPVQKKQAKIAPRVPGMSNVAPARATSEDVLSKRKQEITSKDSIGENDLASFFAMS